MSFVDYEEPLKSICVFVLIYSPRKKIIKTKKQKTLFTLLRGPADPGLAKVCLASSSRMDFCSSQFSNGKWKHCWGSNRGQLLDPSQSPRYGSGIETQRSHMNPRWGMNFSRPKNDKKPALQEEAARGSRAKHQESI